MSRTRMLVLTLGLMALAHPLFAILLIGGPIAVVAFHAWEFLVPPVAWTVFALAGSVLDRSPLPGVPVRPAEEPELASLVAEIAEQLNIRRPLAVRLVPSVDAAVYDQKLRGQPASVIVLGWPLVKHLSASELRAIVAHELAHREHLDDRVVARLLTARAKVAARPLRLLHRWRTALLRATRQVSYDQELVSDAAAARVTGPATVASALVHVERLDAVYALLASTWVDVLAEDETWPEDLYLAMSEALLDPWVTHRIDVALAQLPPHDAEATHPTTRERIAALGTVPAADLGGPLSLREPEALEHQVAELLAEPDESPATVRDMDPDALTDELSSRKLLDEVVALTGMPSQADALVAVHGRVREGDWAGFAMSLDPSIRHTSPEVRPTAERTVMAGALSRLLVSQLRLAGWQRASRWVRSPLVQPNGTTVDVRDVIDRALESGDCSELDDLVSQARDAAVQP